MHAYSGSRLDLGIFPSVTKQEATGAAAKALIALWLVAERSFRGVAHLVGRMLRELPHGSDQGVNGTGCPDHVQSESNAEECS